MSYLGHEYENKKDVLQDFIKRVNALYKVRFGLGYDHQEREFYIIYRDDEEIKSNWQDIYSNILNDLEREINKIQKDNPLINVVSDYEDDEDGTYNELEELNEIYEEIMARLSVDDLNDMGYEHYPDVPDEEILLHPPSKSDLENDFSIGLKKNWFDDDNLNFSLN